MIVEPKPVDEKYCGNDDECCPCLENQGDISKGDILVCGEFNCDIELEEAEDYMEYPLRCKKCLKNIKNI